MHRIFIFVLLALSCELSQQHSFGAPASRCVSLMPGHQGNVSQEFPSPYEIIVSESVIGNGKSLTVEIRSDEPGRTFSGFMLQARTTADPYVLDGSFAVASETPFNFVNCEGIRSTVTNSNNVRRESMVFKWTAPQEYVGKIKFQ